MSHTTEKHKYQQIRKKVDELFEGEEFSESYIKFVLKLLHPNIYGDNDTSLDLALDGLGSNDAGIDAHVIDVDNKFNYIYQFKTTDSYKSKQTISAKDWSYFFDLDTRFDSFENHTNSRVKEIYEEVRENGYKVYHCFVTSFEVTNSEEIIKNYNKKNKPFEIIDLSQIYDKYLEYESERQGDVDRCEIEFINTRNGSEEKEIPYYEFNLNHIGKRKTSIGIVSGAEICRLYEKHHKRLFNRNVRFF